jgi:hypothetical protein
VNAAPDRTALMQQEAAERAKRLRRAAEDVLEGHSIFDASRNRMVDYDALRAELERHGWTPPKRLRQNNSRSRAKQLPQPRSDNQT